MRRLFLWHEQRLRRLTQEDRELSCLQNQQEREPRRDGRHLQSKAHDRLVHRRDRLASSRESRQLDRQSLLLAPRSPQIEWPSHIPVAKDQVAKLLTGL